MTGEAPWIRGDLTIAADVLKEIEAHALSTFPKECCGFLLGPAGEIPLLDEAIREINEADKYHEIDPETFPRTAETYFKINELRASRTFDRGAKQGRPVKVIYHSHCNAGAYFSEEDAATFARDNTLMWPCAFVVVSVRDGAIAEHRLWVHVEGTNDFRESPLRVIGRE